MREASSDWARRRAPELALAGLALAVFLGFLGSVDLWGKREQRASAEAIDTIARGHWLVAQIQGRPRLEKPPLPRWTVAALMALTGRQDEWIVRLPAALSALGMVGLVYALGARLAGRSAGLASGLVLTSTCFFITELRQAGNDGPLAFFTTLALYAAWRRLHGGPDESGPERLGAPGWAVLMYGAFGLGFLCKGPIVLVLAGLAIVPYLATVGRLGEGVRALASGRGLLLFLVLALSWPVPVLLADPNAARVWYLEMAQKAGAAGISHHRHREVLAAAWPWMTAPWSIVATVALALPLLPRGRSSRPGIWFPWWWAVGNLAMFCLWSVAKPNYFLPCLPAVALLTGIEWVRLTRAARGSEAGARRMLQGHWVVLFAGALVAPVVLAQAMPAYLAWGSLASAILAAAVVLSAWAWRRGADAGALAPLVGALIAGVLIGYGAIAPDGDHARSHRELAATLDRILPADQRTLMFFHELDEGLWFYLRDRDLEPVPGSQPRYNEAVDMVDDLRKHVFLADPRARLAEQERILLDWVRKADPATPYVLIRGKIYDLFAPDLEGLATPLYREQGLSRNELVLLRVDPVAAPRPVAVEGEPAARH